MRIDKIYTQCILWGGYGGGNIGDDITLGVALHDMKSKFGNSVAILSSNPNTTHRLFPDVQVIPYEPPITLWYRILRRFNHLMLKLEHRTITLKYLSVLLNLYFSYTSKITIRSKTLNKNTWVQALRNCQQLYLVGGGYLTDLFILSPILLPVFIAKSIEVPINTAPIGIGPFYSKRNSKMVANVLEGIKVIVRDKESLEWCRQNNVFATLRPDDGFRISEIVMDLQSSKLKENLSISRIGVCIFYQHGSTISYSKFKSWWISFLKFLSQYYEIEGFCFHTNRYLDFTTTQEIFYAAGLNPKFVQAPISDFREAVKSLNRYRCIITTRFHAAITAGVLGIPYIAVASGRYYLIKMSAALHPTTPCQLANLDSDSSKEIAENVINLINLTK